jgi:hypothetical protein
LDENEDMKELKSNASGLSYSEHTRDSEEDKEMIPRPTSTALARAPAGCATYTYTNRHTQTHTHIYIHTYIHTR